MAYDIRPRAEDENPDIRDNANASLAQGQQQVAEQAQDTDPAMPSAMAKEQWNLNAEKRKQYEAQVQAAEARRNRQPSAQAWGMVKGNFAREQERQAAYDEKLTAGADIQRQENALAAEKDKLRYENAVNAEATRAHRAQGGETETDPLTGRSTIATNPDGSPRFKEGPLEGSKPRMQRTPQADIASVPGFGDAMTLGGPIRTEQPVQEFRNAYDQVATLPVEEKTDPATGDLYIETKDQFGRPQKIVTGSNQKIKRLLELDQEIDLAAQAKLNFDLQAQQHEPRYKSAKDQFDAAAKEYDVAPKYVQIAGKWVLNQEGIPTDPGEQAKWVKSQQWGKDQYVKNAQDLANWQRTRQAQQNAYGIAKKNLDAVAPAWENLTKQREAAATAEDRARLAKKRLELDLPEDDGGVAEILSAVDGLPPAEKAAVTQYLDSLPTDERMRAERGILPEQQADPAQPEQPAQPDQPLIPPTDDASTVAMFTSYFRGLKNPEQFTVGASGKTFKELKRNGTTVATYYNRTPADSYIAINEYGGADLQTLIDPQANGGIPVYIRDNFDNPPSPSKEAAWAAEIYGAKNRPELQTPEALGAFLEEKQASPPAILKRIKTGELSVKMGGKLLKDLYGMDLQTGDYNDPANLQKWIEETTRRELKEGVNPKNTTAAKWQAANTRKTNPLLYATGAGLLDAAARETFSLSAQEEIKNNRAADYVLTNPLLPRAQAKALYAQNTQHDVSLADSIRSKVTAGAKFAKTSVFGSSLGIFAGIGADLAYAEASLFSENARQQFGEKMRLRGLDGAAFLKGVERTAKAWFTPQGMETSGNVDLAVAEYQRVIDRNADLATPDKAAEDAALQKVIESTLALHNLARDEDDPIEARHLDPNQDKALGSAVARYKATADPRTWELFKSRLLMGNKRRAVSAEMEALTKGQGEFMSAVITGMNAGPQEVAVEPLSWITMGGLGLLTKGGKALNAAAKGNKVWQAARIGKIGKSIYNDLQKAALAYDKLGTAVGTLEKPLTTGQRVGNAMLRGGKLALASMGSEGVEEGVVEFGADDPNMLQAIGGGAFGGLVMLPVGYVQTKLGEAAGNYQQQAKLQDSYHRYAREYNRVNADLPGFQPIDAKTAEFASLFVSPQAREASMQQLGVEIEGLREFITVEQSATAAGQPMDPALPKAEQRLASLEAISTALAQEDIAAIDAVAGFSELAPEEKTNLVAYAKASTGRADLLTPQERRSIQATNTAAGAPVFQGDAVTPEGMAMLVEQFPVLGKLPQFQTADGTISPIFSDVAAANPDIANQSGTSNPIPRMLIDEATATRARSVTSAFMQKVATKSPALAAKMRLATINPSMVTGGLELDIESDTIHVIEEDIARHIAIHPDATDEQLVEYYTEMAYTHETTHSAQASFVDQESAARGLTGTRGQNFQVIYGELAEKYRTESPEAWNMAAELYARNSADPEASMAAWTNMQPFQQAAEAERVFVEAILKGEPTDPMRIMDAAMGKLKERLLMLAKQIGEWIKTGKLTTADGTVLELPETIKARAEQIAQIVEDIRQGKPANATPTPDPSSPDSGNRPSQPAPGKTGAGNSGTPQGDGDSQPAVNGSSQPPPVDDAGASAQSAEVAAAQSIVRAEFDKALESRPLLKKDANLMSGLRQAAMDIRDAFSGRPEAEIKDAAARAIGAYLQSPEVTERLGQIYSEQSAKARAYREAAAARVREEARRIIIQRMPTVRDMESIGRITRPTNALELYRTGQTLPPEWNGMLRSSDYAGGGKNAVARSIIGMIYAADETSGSTPDQIASGLEAEFPEKYAGFTPDMLWQALEKELRGYVNGADTSSLDDPDADVSGLTDEQIQQRIERDQQRAIVEKWRGITGRPGLLPGTAQAYEAEFTKLAEQRDFSPDEDGILRDPFGDEMTPDDRAALEQQAAYAVDERNRPKTPAQTATLNPRVEKLSKPMEGGLVATDAVLETAPLTAAQNHLPGLTRVRQTPLVQRALALAERIIPYFQGNKLKMTGPVVSSQEQYSTAEQRAAVHTMYDLFGGGGAWGIVLAESLYPNLRSIHINEFDSSRAIKIKAQVEYGDQFAAIVNSPEVRNALAAMIAAHRLRPAVQAKIAKQMAAQQQGDFIAPQNLTPEEIAEMNEAWSWGVINKTAAQYAKSLDAATQDRVIAVLKTMADDPERSGPWFKNNPDAEPTVDELVAWFTERHAPKAAAIKQTADRMKARGVDFQFHQGDAYAMEIENGPGTVVVADPPYFATTGYDEVNQKQVVNTDIYRRSADLMASLVENDNHVIYTDEAWWLRKNIDNAIRPADLVEGQKIAGEIGNTLDFTVVAEQIDSLYETLGLHNPAGSPVAASRSASRSRDLHGDNQGSGDGGGNQRGGGTAAVEVPPRTNDQAGLQPSGNPTPAAGEDLTDSTLGSAPSTGMNGRPAVQTADGRTLEAPGTISLYSPAYHGTPHKVDRFRLDKIGTGEGAQAYGWGLYFAESKGVADSYRTGLSRDITTSYNGENGLFPSEVDARGGITNLTDNEIIASIQKYGGSLQRARSSDEKAEIGARWAALYVVPDEVAVRVEEVARTYDSKNETSQAGNLYKVDLKPAEDEYLDWDKPLSEQSEKVKTIIVKLGITGEKIAVESPFSFEDTYDVPATGGAVYEAIQARKGLRAEWSNYMGGRWEIFDAQGRSLGAHSDSSKEDGPDKAIRVHLSYRDMRNFAQDSAKQASDTLLAAGIRGIRYLDGNSRADGQGSYNYVIFDEADIEITEVNGQPVQASALFSPAAAPAKEWTQEEIREMELYFEGVKLRGKPITAKNAFSDWFKGTDEDGIITGYRGVPEPDPTLDPPGWNPEETGSGSSEGIGLYLAKTEQDASFFGDTRRVSFPKPKRPIIVDEDGGMETIPLLNEEAEAHWKRIFSHKTREGDSDWMKAHILAAKQIGLTEDTWVDKIDDYPRALTDKLLAMGYDAVYVRSGGMEWANLLAKPGQRFNRGTRSEGGTALYSAPAQNPSAQYRYLKAKQEKAGLTPAEEQALLRAEQAMGQSMAFDMEDPALKARKGSVSPSFQPQLNLERQHPITGQQLALFSPAASRITPQQDAEYLDAVERGDMETAQRMVDEAARKAGYKIEGWHGSSKDFQAFMIKHAAMFAVNEAKAARYGDARRFYLRSEAPETGMGFREVQGLPYNFGGRTDALKAKGKDSAVTRPKSKDGEWAVFNPNQIKSADPVTYDAQGNVIPLSQRFNPDSDSILYSPAAIPSARFVETLNANHNKPAASYTYGPDTFTDPETQRWLKRQGIQTRMAVELLPLQEDARRNYGLTIAFAAGLGGEKGAAISRNRKNLIIVDADNNLDPLPPILLHEIAHAVQLDPRIARGEVDWAIRSLIPQAIEQVKNDIRSLYPDDDAADLEAEAQAYLVADALVEKPIWPMKDVPNIEEARQIMRDYFYGLPPLETRPEDDLRLFSAAAQPDDQAALEAALRGLDPIYGDVLKASQESPTPSPEELAQRFNLPERAIQNIIGTVRARIQAQGRTIRPGGLQPQRTDDGRLKGGMPKRGNSTTPILAAVDQLQQQEGLPLSKTNREIHDAGRRLASRPDALDHLLAAQRNGAPSAEETAATAHYLREASIRGDQSAKLTELAILYREQGTRQSEEFRARIDQYRTPSERNALIFQDMLTAPNKQTRKAYEAAKTPEAKLAILEAWNAKVKVIKEAMKDRGIDLDAALARLAEQRANVQAGEAYASEAHQKLVDGLNAEVASLRQQLAAAQGEAATAAAQAKLDEAEQNAARAAELDPRNTIRLELEKLRPDERAAIERLQETQDLNGTAAFAYMEVRELVKLVDRFMDAIATAGMDAMELAENILLGRSATLQAPAANAPDSVKERYRKAMAMAKISANLDIDALKAKAAGKPAKQKGRGKAKSPSGPEPAMMSDAEFQARQNNPQTWRPLWQADATLTGQRISFEEWQAKPETQAIKQRQDRMFKQPVSTTTGELDMHDPVSVKRAFDAFSIHSASLFDKAMEFWRTSILSGLQTAIVNFGGNVAHSLYHLGPRRILEAGVNDVLGIIGLGSKDAATLGELRVMSKQIHKALGKAGSDMVRSWATDSRIVEHEVLALGQQLELTGGVAADHTRPAMGGILGTVMRGISFRHMTASDEFLKSFHSHVEVAAHAYRMAKAEGLKGDAMESRIAELMVYGSPAWKKAYTSAEWVTFQSRPDKSDKHAISFLDRFAKGIRRFAQTDTGRTMEVPRIDKDGKIRKEIVPIMKPNAFSFFFPFINTPLNIFKIGIEMSPIGAFFSIVDATRALKERMNKEHLTPEAAKAAAAELYDKQRLVKDITNQIIGAGLFWALGTLVKPDDDDELPFITGSVDWKRTSKGDRDLRAKVMPAYSFRIGKAILSYQRVEPFGTAFGFLVDMRLAVEKHGGINDAALGEFMTTAINQLDNKTYLQGVSDLFNLIHDPERFGTKMAGNLVTSYVPNLIRQPIREADPYVRDTAPAAEDGFMEAVGKRIGYSLAPGYAPPMLDVWGNPILRNPGEKLLGSPQTDLVLRVFDPTHLAIGKDIDPIDRYLFNWNNSQADQKARFNIEPIRDTLTIHRNGITHKVAISPEDHAEANRSAGQAARETLGNDWNPLQPTEEGVERIKDTLRSFQKRERDRLRAKYSASLPAE